MTFTMAGDVGNLDSSQINSIKSELSIQPSHRRTENVVNSINISPNSGKSGPVESEIRHPATGHILTSWRSETQIPWELYCGQAVEGLHFLADRSVNCVVTSPPYFWQRDYNEAGQIGLEDNVSDYVSAIVAVMNEIYRVLTPGGTVFLNIGDTYYSGKGASHGVDKKNSKRRFGIRAVDKSGGLGLGLQRKSTIGIPWRVALTISESNWVLRSPIIWVKEASLPEYVLDRPSRGYEYVFLFVKSRHYYFDKKKLPETAAEDVWTIPVRTGINGVKETAPFPEELVTQCLAVGCPPGGTVLDPFCGSGTTLRAALKTGHPAVGIDISRRFCEYVITDLSRLPI